MAARGREGFQENWAAVKELAMNLPRLRNPMILCMSLRWELRLSSSAKNPYDMARHAAAARSACAGAGPLLTGLPQTR